jgi:hypothetical protein
LEVLKFHFNMTSDESLSSKVLKDTIESARRNRSAFSKGPSREGMQVLVLSTPVEIKKQDSLFSPGATTASDSSYSAEEYGLEIVTPDSLAMKKPSFSRSLSMKRMSRKGSSLVRGILRRSSSLAFSGRHNRNCHIDGVLQDHLDQSIKSVGTETIRHENITHGRKEKATTEDPGVLRRKADRYKKKALDLLSELNASKKLNGGTHSKDPKEIEGIGRKAYRFAMESRRLLDLAEKMTQNQEEESAVGQGNAPERISTDSSGAKMVGETSSESAVSDLTNTVYSNEAEEMQPQKGGFGLLNCSDGYSCRLSDDDDAVLTKTPFRRTVELDEHQRRMKELELFSEDDLWPKLICGSTDAQSTVENERLMESMEELGEIRDLISVTSPDSFLSSETTASELAARKEHEAKMKELELFSPESVWKSVLRTIRFKKTAEESQLNNFPLHAEDEGSFSAKDSFDGEDSDFPYDEEHFEESWNSSETGTNRVNEVDDDTEEHEHSCTDGESYCSDGVTSDAGDDSESTSSNEGSEKTPDGRLARWIKSW